MKFHHISISLRLATWFAAILFLGWLLFGFAMRFELEHVLTSSRYQTLDRRADRLTDLLQRMAKAPNQDRALKFQEFASATGDGLIDIFLSDGSRLFPAPSPEAASFPWPHPVGHEQFVKIKFNGLYFRALSRSVQIEGHDYYLCLAAPLAGNLRLLDSFTWGLILAIPILLLVSALGGYVVCRQALAPVDRITASVRSITVWNLSGRLPVPQSNDELRRLTETCNDMLERLENAVTRIRQFTSNASHELRHPLCFARTTAEVALLNQTMDANSRHAFQEIVDECAKASTMLDNLLTLARADSGTLDRNFAAVDLATLVPRICHQAENLAFAKGHTLSLQCDADVDLRIRGDQTILERLIWILLDNAIKYTPASGKISVRVTCREQQICIEVEDNGIGIAPDDLPLVCERFFRSQNARTHADGSGLGLAIAQWITELHHATLSVQPLQHSGTCMRVAFPPHTP